MNKHHDDGTQYSLEGVEKKLRKDTYGPEVVDVISWLVEQIRERDQLLIEIGIENTLLLSEKSQLLRGQGE